MSTPTRGTLFACDIGNSRAGFALAVDGQIEQVVRVPLAGLDGLAECFRLDPRAAKGQSALPVIASSVNEAAAEKLRTVVKEFTSAPLMLAGRDFLIPIENGTRQPDRVGKDRLLAALAAYRTAHKAVIVIDVGTAITVDAVDGDGRFLGGAILPGPSLGAWALHQRTAALPEVTFSAPVEVIGQDTEAAIRAGLVLGTAGAIERLVAEQSRRLNPTCNQATAPRVVGTGGGLEVVRGALRCLDDVRPNLVLEGLVAAYLAQ